MSYRGLAQLCLCIVLGVVAVYCYRPTTLYYKVAQLPDTGICLWMQIEGVCNQRVCD
jgi:hypothetical protein